MGEGCRLADNDNNNNNDRQPLSNGRTVAQTSRIGRSVGQPWDSHIDYRRKKQTCRHANISEIYSGYHHCATGGERDPDQASVNEYKAGQGLGPHVDNKEHSIDRISILSLGDPVSMVFQRVDRRGHSTRDPPVRLLLEPNSPLILKGRARYEYSHCIPHCWEDIVNGVPSKRGRRVSVTLRHMSEETLNHL